MNHKTYLSFLAAAGLVATLATASQALAASTTPPAQGNHQWNASMMGGGVFGTVSAVNGNTLTVTDSKNSTTYTVDAGSATVRKNGTTSSLSAVAVGDMVMVQGSTSGNTVTAKAINDGVGGRMGPGGMASGVFGTVSAVSGNTVTVTSKGGPKGTATATTYTVDATNATVMKNGASSSLSAIAVGDMVMVQGTVSGDSVTAKTINDGMMMRGPGGRGMQNPVITGNGEPVVGGSITAINGTTLTLTNKGNITYSVDAANATVEKGNATSTLSNVAVGDNVVVQGSVNGTSVTASSVIDQGASTQGSGANNSGAHPGILGMIGNFFEGLFKFF